MFLGVNYKNMNTTKTCNIYLIFCLTTNLLGNQEVQQPSSMLNFFYTSKVGSFFRPLFTHSWFSTLSGWYADTRLSKMHIKKFVKQYNINMNEAERSNIKQYRSFNDFFTRKLKPEARPLDHDSSAIICPTDGILYAFQTVDTNTELFVKDKKFDVATFLGSKKLAEQFKGGTLIIIYLAPWHYHRFHMPLDAIPSFSTPINGSYESVHPMVYQAGVQPLLENERRLIMLDTLDCGTIAFLPVGALCVGRIVETYTPHSNYLKGAELGYFAFGGSTIVLFFEKDTMMLSPTIKEKLSQQQTIDVKMGERIGTKSRFNDTLKEAAIAYDDLVVL